MLNESKIINQIIKKINKGNLMIFAGAGISIPSKLPSGKKLVKNIINQLNEKAKTIKINIDDEMLDIIGSIRPEVLFDIIQDSLLEELNLNELLSGFNDAQPNLIHYFIAQLLVDGKIAGVITTNYDLLIEQAFKEIKNLKKAKMSLKIIVNKEDLAHYNKRFIFKIHGSLKNEESTLSQDRLNPFYTISHFANIPIRFKEKFKEILEQHDLLVLGYSGNDDFSLKPIFLSVKNTNDKNLPQLFWIEHYNKRYQHIESFDKRSPEQIIKERDSEHKVLINNYRDENFLIEKLSILIESDTSNFINLLIKQLNYLSIIPSQNETFNPFSGFEKWFSKIPPELAGLCLIKMLQKHFKPNELMKIFDNVSDNKVNNFAMPIKAQWKLEKGIINKESGIPLKAYGLFDDALRNIKENYNQNSSQLIPPPYIIKLAHRIQYMWGFTLNDEKKFDEAVEKFKEKSIFGENLKALCEACWPIKDSGKLEEAQNYLENLLKYKCDILNEEQNKEILSEIYDSFSWILTDLAKEIDLYEERKKVWKQIIDYNNRAKDIIKSQFDLGKYGSYLRSGAIQKLQMIEQHLDLKNELTSFIFNGSDFMEEVNNDINEAISIFQNIDRNQDILFTLTAKIRLLYIEKNFIMGDKILGQLQMEKFKRYLTHWAKEQWMPNEIKNLKELKEKISKYYSNQKIKFID